MNNIPYRKRKLLTGNSAAAIGAAMACLKGGVIPVYPITPQTEIMEILAQMCAMGIIKARFIPVESEHSAMMACIGASPYARTFTATSSHGLKFMSEALHSAANTRLPIVMVNVSRGMGLPFHLWCDHNDIMTERDQGWGIFFAETNQEILDSILIAFYLAEKENIKVPIIVNIDGFISSHTAEPVIIPTQKQVDDFLPAYNPARIDYENPKTSYAVRVKAPLYYDMKQKQFEAMEILKTEIPKAYKHFEEIFGRNYGNGLIENCGLEKSETVIISYASHFGVIREAVNELMDLKALKIKTLRPFPQESIVESLRHAKKILVIDRNISTGIGGVFTQEIKAILQNYHLDIPVYSAIAGLGGETITVDMIKKCVSMVRERSPEESISTIWLRNEKEKRDIESVQNAKGKIIEINTNSPYLPSHTACAGCGAAAPLSHILRELGEKTHLIIPACCHSITTGGETGSNDYYETTIWSKKIKVRQGINIATNTEHTLFAAAAATATGKLAAIRQLGYNDAIIACWAGDGGTYDIGLQALSGACERNESMLYICYNNQAYMNTGAQRSGATPLGAFTNTSHGGKAQSSKDMMRIIAAHRIPYAATIILDKKHLSDLKNKIRKAKEIVQQDRGLVYLELFSPCPPGWGCDTGLTEKLSLLAFETKIWPLYEVFDGKIYKIQKPRELAETEQFELIKEYVGLQRRFKRFTDEDIKNMQILINKNYDELLKLEMKPPRA